MGVFAVIASNDTGPLESIIQSKIAEQDYHKVDPHTWLVSSPGSVVTPKELSDFLGVSSGAAGRVMVLHVTTYYGFHSRETWDWLSVKGV